MVSRLSNGGGPRTPNSGAIRRQSHVGGSSSLLETPAAAGRSSANSSASSAIARASAPLTMDSVSKAGAGRLDVALPREVEGLDISTYANLRHAFEVIVQSYAAQKEALESDRRQWADERKDLLAREQNLAEALTAVREALDAETDAHDKDLETLENVMARNAELDQQLRVMHKRVHQVQETVVRSAQSPPAPASGGSGTAGAGSRSRGHVTSDLSSSLRVLAGSRSEQRYDAATDSYSYQVVGNHQRENADRPDPREGERWSSASATTTAALAREVSMLRRAYVGLKEKLDESGAEGNVGAGAFGVSPSGNADVLSPDAHRFDGRGGGHRVDSREGGSPDRRPILNSHREHQGPGTRMPPAVDATSKNSPPAKGGPGRSRVRGAGALPLPGGGYGLSRLAPGGQEDSGGAGGGSGVPLYL